MHLPTLLRDYAAYNLWANTQFVHWLRAKPAELLETPLLSSFPTLKATLLHIWDAEIVWMKRLQGESLGGFPSATFAGSHDELFDGLLAHSTAFRDYVQGQPDDYFSADFSFTHFQGTAYTQPRAEALLHCFQHGTMHRGQLITMGRALGLTDPPKSDYIFYTRHRP